jgi:hypothetical protein
MDFVVMGNIRLKPRICISPANILPSLVPETLYPDKPNSDKNVFQSLFWLSLIIPAIVVQTINHYPCAPAFRISSTEKQVVYGYCDKQKYNKYPEKKPQCGFHAGSIFDLMYR